MILNWLTIYLKMTNIKDDLIMMKREIIGWRNPNKNYLITITKINN